MDSHSTQGVIGDSFWSPRGSLGVRTPRGPPGVPWGTQNIPLEVKNHDFDLFSRSEPEIIIYNREKPRRDTLGTCADVFRGFGGSKTNFAFIFSSKSSKMVIFDDF